jgi:hypothetical protein
MPFPPFNTEKFAKSVMRSLMGYQIWINYLKLNYYHHYIDLIMVWYMSIDNHISQFWLGISGELYAD